MEDLFRGFHSLKKKKSMQMHLNVIIVRNRDEIVEKSGVNLMRRNGKDLTGKHCGGRRPAVA